MYYFMDTDTFEEVSITVKAVGDKAGFMVEGMNLEVRGKGTLPGLTTIVFEGGIDSSVRVDRLFSFISPHI